MTSSEQQKLTAPLSADDISGLSPSPRLGAIEPAACKLTSLYLYFIILGTHPIYLGYDCNFCNA